MKKILEVCQYGDFDIRFNTDIKPEQLKSVIPELPAKFACAMTTSLWGGNEAAVLAMIRSLAIADFAVSVNRKEMIRMLDESSANLARLFKEAQKDFEAKGGRIDIFGPGIMPQNIKS
ncbi:MAG: hypothetical protein J6Y66_06885 [Bacteroidales bacterium]|nr:hypothetical protein [Bacteroidales bacterium]